MTEVLGDEARVAGRLPKPARRGVAQRVGRDLLLDPGTLDGAFDERREDLRLQSSAGETAEDGIGRLWSFLLSEPT